MSDGDAPTNYAAIECPPSLDAADEPPPSWHYTTRRSFIHQYITQAGSPEAINQAELARVFDVDRSTISRDVSRVSESAMADVDADRLRWSITQTMQTALREQSRNDEWDKAVRTAESLANWVERAGLIDTTPDEHHVVSDTRVTTADADDDDGPRGFLSKRSEAHFARLTERAEEATRDCTVSPEEHGDGSSASGTQPTKADSGGCGSENESGSGGGHHSTDAKLDRGQE